MRPLTAEEKAWLDRFNAVPHDGVLRQLVLDYQWLERERSAVHDMPRSWKHQRCSRAKTMRSVLEECRKLRRRLEEPITVRELLILAALAD